MEINKEKVVKLLENKKVIKTLMIACVGIAIAFYGLVYSFRMAGWTAGAEVMFEWVKAFAIISVIIYMYMMFKFDKKDSKNKIDEKDLVHFSDYQTTAYCGNKDAMNLSTDWNKVNCADCLEKNITATLERQLDAEVVSTEKENEKEQSINT